MSKGGNYGGTFVDTGLLRDHVSKLRREKNIVSELYANVRAMRNLSDPTISYQYNSILRDIEQMIEYFERMASVLAHVDDEAVQLSLELRNLIESDTENTHRTISKTIML